MGTTSNSATIGVVATTSAFFRITKELCRCMNINAIIKMGAFKQGVDVARNMIRENGVSAIISRGTTGRLIEQSVQIPAYIVEINSFDLLKAYHRAKKYDKNILFIDAYREKYYYEITVVEEIIGTKIHQKLFQELDEMSVILQEAKQNGFEIIVATAECVVDLAKKMNLQGIMIDSTEKDIRETLVDVQSSLRYLQMERENYQWAKTVMDSIDDGIISVEHTGIVRQINTNAAKILGMMPGDVVGKNIEEIKLLRKNKELFDLINGKTELYGKIISTDNTKVVFSRTPIHVDGAYTGIYIKMQRYHVIQELESKVRHELHQKGFVAKAVFADIIGESKVIDELKQRAKAFAKYSTTILIQGESGTGKELFAQSIHNASPRKQEAFVAVNCAALSESLLESELFGYEEGAFTGAVKGGKVGLFEIAHNGTIFLDEIGEVSQNMQAKLLRVIQEKEIMRVGSNRIIPVDTRILCASNKDLRKKVAKGEFREDLYYRINTVLLAIPPLSGRREDIPSITRSLVAKKNKIFGSQFSLNKEMLSLMLQCKWSGNVRELESFVERYIILSQETPEKKDDEKMALFRQLLDEIEEENDENASFKNGVSAGEKLIIEPGTLKDIEEQAIRFYVKKFSGNRRKVCQALDIGKTTLWRKYANISSE
jgi:transcriptional regulator with PAS, ATPase and Fis domain